MLETFKQLKQNDRIRVSMTDALIGKRKKTLSVGRRTHSKKYNVESSVHAIGEEELERLSDAIFSKKGSVSKVSQERATFSELNLNLSPTYKMLQQRVFEKTIFKISYRNSS